MEIVIGIIGLVVALLCFEFWIRRRRRFSKRDHDYVLEQWEKLVRHIETVPDKTIMEADKLLAYVLKKKGYSGTLGEMLRQAHGVFRDNNGLWQAHKLRNKIAHEVDHRVEPRQAKAALQSFKKALWDLGIKIP